MSKPSSVTTAGQSSVLVHVPAEIAADPEWSRPVQIRVAVNRYGVYDHLLVRTIDLEGNPFSE